MNTYEYLLKDINTIKGIGPKLSKLFRKKNINTIFDLIWSIPRDTTDRTNLVKIDELLDAEESKSNSFNAIIGELILFFLCCIFVF